MSRKRSQFLRTSAEGGGGGNSNTTGGGATESQATSDPNGFAPINSQADLDRIVQDRLRREQAKYRDYDTLKAKAEQFDILAQESQTDRERELEQARLEAYHEAMGTVVPAAVRAEFKSAAKGVLTDQQLQSLIEDLDLTKYATDDGLPDEERIAKKISAFAPAQGNGGGRRGSTDFGQGQRRDSTLPKGEAGLLEAQRRFGQKAESTS